MARTYFVLVSIDGSESHAEWRIEFGDYERETVEFERDDMREGSDGPYVRFKIIRTTDDQETINAAVDALNGRNSDLVERPIR